MNKTVRPIFLVEDNSLYVNALEKRLSLNINSGTSIHKFANGEECIKNMGMNPKIVVLDYFLNSASREAMNGLEVLKKIKITNPETMVLMLSNQDDIQIATDTMKYGAFDYVSKNENAFLRLQNAINNIEKILAQATVIKTGQQVKRILIAWIIFLVVTIAVLQIFFPGLMNKNM